MVKKIVSHLAPRHMDDFLAIALLKAKYPHAEVEYVHPQQVPQKYLEDPSIILVDVGGDFSPEKRNYDHHQDLSIPCSLVLVLENEDITGIPGEIINHPTVRFIDLTDRYGVKKASEEMNVPLSREIDEMRKTILLTDPEKHASNIAKVFFYALSRTDNYNEFMKLFYEELDRKGILREAKEKIREEERKFQEKLKNAKVITINGLTVVVSTESFAPYHYRAFQRFNADIIVERNSMNPNHTSIIKNTSSPKTQNIDLSKVFSKYPKVFIHKTGFIAVIDVPIENIDVQDLVNLL